MTEEFWISNKEWSRDPSEAHQTQLRRPLPGDDALVHITAYEAEKCLSILRGYLDGLELYRDSVELVAQLLSVRALTAKEIPSAAADPWPRIEAVPWPPPKGLREG